MDYLTNKFISLEIEFKKQYPGKSNLLSYSLVIYCLLKKNNYYGWEHVIIPKNKDEQIDKIMNLLQ